ncbi:polyprenyl synthetase family protein [Roseimarinus sediminis]|jgi:octaprenyl-diphosphate synthase|uniref:polyprenyl synthetase family protein n=1 Tax=Roseimarinus sediminis TaxID=1610899 RepID=UPI003D1ACA99
MSKLEKIKEPVAHELKEFEHFFKEATRSDVKLLNLIVNYLIRTKGKQIRPLFVFLSAKMHGEINRSTYVAATSIELLHSATLVHDDVIDESFERRGKLSINALWKNKIAVLIGDFLLSKGLLITTKEKEYRVLDIMSEAVRETIEGELLQSEKSRKLDIDERTYFEIISKKTASLIGTSLAVGAHSAIKDDVVVEEMRQIGLLAGLAFQIRDDIFDYQDKGIIGKPTGNDIKEKKITLPLIHVLNNASKTEKREILRIVKRKNLRKEKVNELIDLVVERGGLEYASERMNFYCDEAIRRLEVFPKNEASEALAKLFRYVITRKR